MPGHQTGRAEATAPTFTAERALAATPRGRTVRDFWVSLRDRGGAGDDRQQRASDVDDGRSRARGDVARVIVRAPWDIGSMRHGASRRPMRGRRDGRGDADAPGGELLRNDGRHLDFRLVSEVCGEGCKNGGARAR